MLYNMVSIYVSILLEIFLFLFCDWTVILLKDFLAVETFRVGWMRRSKMSERFAHLMELLIGMAAPQSDGKLVLG